MARFDLFRLAGDEGYVVDVQSNHASEKVRTRVVVPLVPVAKLGKPIADLNGGAYRQGALRFRGAVAGHPDPSRDGTAG